MMKLLKDLSRVKSLSNAPNANFGLKKIKVVITWFVGVNLNFAINAAKEFSEAVCALKKRIVIIFNLFFINMCS